MEHRSTRDHRATKAAASAIAFRGFGASMIPETARRALDRLTYDSQLEQARKQALARIPVCPGVYGWLDAEHCLLYVGKSKSLRHRLVSYFSRSPSDPKMERIRRHSTTIVWEAISHELLALVREQELIDRFRPSFNVQGKPERRQPGFVCVSKGPAATAFFADRIPPRAASGFGPIAGTGELRQAICSLNYAFQLRDCPEQTKLAFANQLRLFGDELSPQCLRHELKTCLGPCAAGCTKEAYRRHTARLEAFLKGNDSILRQLRKRMISAATDLAFERACVLRDQFNQLSWLHRRLRQLAEAQTRLHGFLKVPGFDHSALWLQLNHGHLQQCSTDSPRGQKPSSILKSSSRAEGLREMTSSLQVNLLLLFVSWLKRNPQQAGTVIPFDDALDSRPNGVPAGRPRQAAAS